LQEKNEMIKEESMKTSLSSDFLSLFRSQGRKRETVPKKCCRKYDYALVIVLLSKRLDEIFNG